MLDENVQQNQDQMPEGNQLESEDTNVDYKSLYLDEVQNAKNLRKRAQSAELTIKEFSKAKETEKIKSLKEQEKFQELAENLQKKLDEVTPFKEKFEAQEMKTKEELLSQLPEEDRESMASKDIDTLKYIVNLKQQQEPVNPSHTPGMPRKVVMEKSWSEMTDDEKRAYYDEKAGS